jgi:eukaryotic-like serine/threonine-protein kinase
MPARDRALAFGPFRLDAGERLLLRGGQPVALTPKAFDLLVHLVERPGRLVEKQALMAALWPDAVVEEANLAYTVSALRKALGEGQDGEQFIQTVPTRGYRFVAPVAETGKDDREPWAPRRGRAVAVAGAGVVGLIAAFAWWRGMESNRAPRPVVRFVLASVTVPHLVTPVISPDGTRVLYAGGPGPQRQLYLRPLDSLEAILLPGTANADDPTFSPDGRAVAFFIPPAGTTKGKLMTLELATGRLSTIWALGGAGEGPLGSTWGPNGRIYFGSGYVGIRAVPVSGGTPVAVTTTRPGEGFHGAPEILPDGRHLMFQAWRSDDIEHASVNVVSLETGERRTILEGVAGARYLSTGHIAYMKKGALFAVRFDPRTLKTRGAPVQVVGGVATTGGGAQLLYSVSSNGTLVYHPGPVLMERTELSWASGSKEERIAGPPGYYTDPSLSPDDRWLAVAPHYGVQQQVWVHDFRRGTWTCPTTSGMGVAPIWHPLDPARIVYTASRSGAPGLDLFSIPADGSGPPDLLHASHYPKYASSSSSAGRLIAFTEMHPETRGDVWLLDLRDQPVARPLVSTPAWEGQSTLSPDGRWIAYSSNETGRPEIYVRSISGTAGRWIVSTEGGSKPRWSRDGRRIVYRNAKGMWAVDVVADSSFSAGPPRLLREGGDVAGAAVAPYEIAADGRILLITPADDQPSVPLVVVQNWFTEIAKTIGE